MGVGGISHGKATRLQFVYTTHSAKDLGQVGQFQDKNSKRLLWLVEELLWLAIFFVQYLCRSDAVPA